MHAILFAIWLAAAVEVHSSVACPAQDAIAARLSPLLPTMGTASRDQAHLVAVPGQTSLRLRLTSADGTLIGSRDLPVSDRCDELAEFVAVLLASWESAPQVGLAPLPEPPVPAPRASVGSLARNGWEVQAGAGAGVAAVGGTAVNGRLEMAVSSPRSHWQWRAGFMTQTARKTAVDPGHAVWRHTAGALSLVWRTLDRSWLFSADVGPTLGAATVSGQGFATNEEQQSLEYGLESGLRLGRRWGRLTIFVDLRGEVWLQRQRAIVVGRSTPLALDPWDVAAGLGASVAFFP